MSDARFEDGADRPLRLAAQDNGDLPALAALLQDAVLTAADLTYSRKARRFAALINRFRWEDRPAAERANRPFERTRALLVIEDVTAAQLQGLTAGDSQTVLSLLTLTFTPGDDGTGTLTLTFAGDGAIRLSVECLNLTLSDMTRPYMAPSRRAPEHPGT
jgi:hypothetical protein